MDVWVKEALEKAADEGVGRNSPRCELAHRTKHPKSNTVTTTAANANTTSYVIGKTSAGGAGCASHACHQKTMACVTSRSARGSTRYTPLLCCTSHTRHGTDFCVLLPHVVAKGTNTKIRKKATARAPHADPSCGEHMNNKNKGGDTTKQTDSTSRSQLTPSSRSLPRADPSCEHMKNKNKG